MDKNAANAKPIRWVGSSLDELRSFPEAVKDKAGYQLHLVQLGFDPQDFKPMPAIGPGAFEIRVRDQSGAFRIFYVARFEEGIYVLHCFQKKTQRTSPHDLNLGKRRYSAALAIHNKRA